MKGTAVSTSNRKERANDTDGLLRDFFRSERPRVWPEPPWRKQAVTLHARHSLRGRSVLVAALVLAALGLSFLGEVPNSWPGPRSPLIKSKMEASRPSKTSEAAPRNAVQKPKDTKAHSEKP